MSRMYHVEFWPVSNRFAAGHRIQLSLVGQSAFSMPTVPGLTTVALGAGAGTRPLFPAVPGDDPAAALR